MDVRVLVVAVLLAAASDGGVAGAAPLAPATEATAPAVTPSAADLVALRAAAARNEAWAQYDLGKALACGRGVARDRTAAARWFRRAADQGHVQAQSVVGWMYMTGSGVPRDDARALHWLSRAAEQGDTSAQNNLGIVYAQGRGVPVDREQAEKWFRKAADQGAADAARNLDKLRNGKGRTVRPSAEPPVAAG